MQARRKITIPGLVSVAIGSFLLAGAAHAATITAEYVKVTGGEVSGSVRLSGDSNTSKGGIGGQFEFKRISDSPAGSVPPLVSNAAGNFLSFCLELSETISNTSKVYNFVPLEVAPDSGSLANPMSDLGRTGTRADDLRRLLGYVLPDFKGPVENVDASLSASLSPSQRLLAVQLAVWEIANENWGGEGTGKFDYELNSGYMIINQTKGVTSSVFNQAQSWLDMLDSTWTPLKNLFAIVNTTTGRQDQVVQVVPIPAAAWLLGSGLLGLFAVARRKKNAA